MIATVLGSVLAVVARAASVLAQAEPPDEVGYVWLAYGLAVVVLAGYAAFTIVRGRRVGRRLPPDERRWM